ncbi:MAG: hypothetical protein WCR97_00255 [Bacilli bacterium]
MAIIWLNKKHKEGIATLCSKSITLNKAMISDFDGIDRVMVGFDEQKKNLLIKPLSGNELARGDIDEDSIYKISINSTYVRLTSKPIIEEINKIFDIGLINKSIKKFKTSYDERDKIVIIDLKEEVE